MKVVLFCGGMGTRLGEHTEKVPKPLVRIGYRPILWHVMKYYAHYGHKDFILCLGFMADKIKEYFLNYNEYLSNDFTMTNGGRDIHLNNSDILDWKITFVDTGLNANIGQRLRAVQSYLQDQDMFLANYADGLTTLHLPDYIDSFTRSGRIGCFICVRPPQTFHVVSTGPDTLVQDIRHVQHTDIRINGGYFVFRRDIFRYIGDGEELIEQPFRKLIQEGQLIAFPQDQFWCMDTFKDYQQLSDMYARGEAPWEVWRDSTLRLAGVI